MTTGSSSFWATKDPHEAADRVRAFAARFAQVQSSRREQAEKYASVTEGVNLTSLGPWGYVYDQPATFDETEIPVIRNTAHAVVDTLTSKIGAIDPPLPAMLTNRASWKERRQAQDLEDLVRAEYACQKGLFPTLHELWIAGLRLAAAATGAVAVQFYNDSGRVNARLHDTLDMFWSDDLRTQGVITWLSVDDAVELYGEDFEVEIRTCAGEPPEHWRTPTRNGEKLTDYVAIYEAWRGATPDGKPGKYVVCVKNGVALNVEDYPHRKPPFVWLRCTPHLYGPLGHCLVHHIYESIKRDNLVLQKVDRAINRTNESTTYVERGALVQPDALATVEDGRVVEINPGTNVPTTIAAPGFAPEHLQVADRHREDAHDVSGLAASHSSGVRQPGVDSAIGQRYVAALINERFASLQRAYVQAVAVESAELIIQVLCEIYQEDRKMTRLMPGQDTLREVAGGVALKGIEQLKYVVKPAAVSGSKNSPADRMQSAFELRQLGILSDTGFAAMQARGYDLPEELEERDVAREWIDTQIHRWMFASDEDAAEPDFYQPPFVTLGPDKLSELAMRAVDGLLDAQTDELEPERQEYFYMFLADCDALLQQAAPPPSPPGAPPGPQMPPGLPAPGQLPI